MSGTKTRLTITELARETGVSSRTIRFWSDRGLIPIAQRSAARYRLYDQPAIARLLLVRTLRELGLGLPEITQILKRQQSLAQVAATHITAIDAKLRELTLQRAVLRAVVQRSTNHEETQRMHELLQASASERRRIVAELIRHVFEGVGADAPNAIVAQAMHSLPPELPDDPSGAQVEAWLELVELLTDRAFGARARGLALADAAAELAQPIDIAAIREHAQAALDAGVSPTSEAAQHVLNRIAPGSTMEERLRWRRQLAAWSDVHVERYWQLMAVLAQRPAFPPVAAAVDWYVAALRARE